MSRLNCAVCGAADVTNSLESETGAVALCDGHYHSTKKAADALAAADAAARRTAMGALDRIRIREEVAELHDRKRTLDRLREDL